MNMFLFLFGTYLGMDFLSHLVTAFNGLKNDKAIFQTDPFYFLPLCKYHAVVDYLHKNTIRSISRGIKQSSKQCICFSGLELSANFTSTLIWRDGTSLQKVTLSLQSQKKTNSYQLHKALRLLHLSPPHTLSLTEQPAGPKATACPSADTQLQPLWRLFQPLVYTLH